MSISVGSQISRISWPNRISLTRILLIVPFVLALLHLQDPGWADVARWFALGVFAVMAISDALDGYLARRLGQESAVGRFLDPLADKLLVLVSVVLLASAGTHVPGAKLPAWVAVIAVSKDLIVVLGFVIIYMGTSKVFIKPHPLGKMCTVSQLGMVISVLLFPNLPSFLAWLPRLLWWLASLLAVATVIKYIQFGRQFLSRHEDESMGEEGGHRKDGKSGEFGSEIR